MTEDDATEDSVVVAGPDFARRRIRATLRRRRPYLYAGGALVLVLVVGWLVFFSSALTVHRVEVSGTTKVSPARIERAAGVPLHEQLVRVDLAAIQARVKARIPALESVAVSRSWPHTIHIAVTERVPIAIVDRGVGLQAVDVHGALFNSYKKAPANLPVIHTDPQVRGTALAGAATVVTSMPRNIADKVEHVDVGSGEQITLELDGGISVTWGTADSSDQKAEVLAALLAHVTKKNPVSSIDVSVPGRPTTR